MPNAADDLPEGAREKLIQRKQEWAGQGRLLTGHAADWDRRLMVKTAPAFGIIGEPLTLTLRLRPMK